MPGRLHPGEERDEIAHYPVPEGIEIAPLPWYGSLANPLAVGRALLGSVRTFWRVLNDVDAVLLFGPHPSCFVFATLAALRGRRVVLGVRQDLPAYTRNRHPNRRSIQFMADTLEAGYRLLARLCATVVVGPDLARNYRRARRLLPINVSLIRESDIAAGPSRSDYDGELQALSVGRLEAEKNPLLLADALAALGPESQWRLTVCGEGALAAELGQRLEQLDVADRARLAGYVPIDSGLLDLYRESHALLHVSWTEGLPQILFEAFAAGLPVVATAVGGVADAAGDAALLIPPGDADAAARALERVAGDAELREQLVRAGLERARAVTLEAECERLVRFITS
ncbi:MAG TPA: glycosyltransferase family 4 protein [Solirubrobacterales bacterium]|nr:glycosyltransferase family 4 protein [Solirubrobacterales bacterium]